MDKTELKYRRLRLGLTQCELGRASGIRQSHLSEMEAGLRPIGRHCADRLDWALLKKERQRKEERERMQAAINRVWSRPHLVDLRAKADGLN